MASQENIPSQENPDPAPSRKIRKRRGSRSNGGSDPRLKELLLALQAARDGDFSIRLNTGNGIIGKIFRVFNQYVELNEWRGAELMRVSKAIGEEGRLTERAPYARVKAGWRQSVEAVNNLIDNLVQPTTEVGRVITAVARGDLSEKMRMEIDGRPLKGEFLQIGNIVNTMVDQLSSFAGEVTRVAREVGTEGKLGGQAEVKGVAGTWKGLTDNVNAMANSLTSQVRNIAEVTTAVAQGDLSRKITVQAQGEILQLKNTINTMVDQLNSFASEVSRVAREVGTEGKLGGQAVVPGVAGTWKDLTNNVNWMADNLTGQVRNIAEVTKAVAQGDLSKKITVDVKGEILELKNTINTMVDQLSAFAAEVTRVAREVGTEGKLGGQARVEGVAGTWKDLTDNVNGMANNLTGQVRNIAEVTTAVAQGDLSKKITVEVKGEILELKNTINTMVDQLSAFAAEVTRVAREVGTEGKLGGQAKVEGVAGTWKDLTDNVNGMANNLTGQVRNIAEVSKAIAQGDLSKKITVEVKGEILELKNTINTMVDQLSAFAAEVTRVAREVGTEGKLGGQAKVEGVAGTWKDLTDNVNGMANNLTGQVRNIAEVTTAVAQGDLSKKITVEVKGEILELKNTVNTMVDQLSAFAAEVSRVAREVGTEGKLGGQADVKGVAGTWKDLTDNVNYMATNLTDQVRNIAEVTTAVAQGDLSKKITVEVKGEILRLKNTINTMVDQLSAFAAEVTRVAKEVGTDGKLGGQAEVKGVAGTWKDLTDNVNKMATNLTDQVRNIAAVTTAVAQGDLSKKITVEVRGEILELKNTINTMVDQLNAFASEVSRVAREVGTEGKLGGQARVEGVGGTWKDLTDNVNYMATNLTDQVRNIAAVTTAVAQGDLSKKITVFVKGEILELKNTINTMVDQLNAFASEVTRVAKEVGTDGRLGGQAEVRGVSGIWKDLTDNVNRMATNLTDQVRNIALVTTGVANGDLSQKITVDARGEILQLKNTINRMVDQLNAFAAEVTRVAKEVGTDGKLGGQAEVKGVSGTWKDLTDNVNAMAGSLTSQVRDIAKVTTAVADGDLSQKITVDARGEILQLKDTINKMVDQLNSFASEVSRVAREVGTEGKLGGQAELKGVAGTWKDLTDNVNRMANNLTDQVRNIALVTTAVAQGDLSKKITVEVKGEILELKNTINTMVDQLNAFAAEVTRVAREVGTFGILGGQARVGGVAGTWKDLTDNVNQLAANLTTQVRAIADVATAVTRGDLTRSVAVEAQGEVEELKNNINQMIVTLKETTQKNIEQDWLKTNLAKFSRMLQGQRDLQTVAQSIMSELTPLVSAQHGVFYVKDSEGGQPLLKLLSSYGYKARKTVANKFEIGESLVGQCALEKKPILITNPPEDYIKISSGLGEGTPQNIIVLPVLFEGQVLAITELASFDQFSQVHQLFLEQLMESLGVVLNMIGASMRTEELLKQSQALAGELQSQQEELKRSNEELEEQTQALKASQELLRQQQEELQRTNEDLEEKARLLSDQKKMVETKNRELELAQASLQEKAEQLAITSKYKSEFLANMSHELRTPLNSILLLARLVGENKDKNLSPKQIDYLQTIYASGNDLLGLINEVLDLSKIEAGKMDIQIQEFNPQELESFAERSFRQIAEQKGLDYEIKIDESAPALMKTDPQRLEQVLRNLLSNAFKFTDSGKVELNISAAGPASHLISPILREATNVVAISVTDSGIGIPKDKQRIIFEAFQQGDSGANRKHGGTGLGLTISREIIRLLGGEIHLSSEQGQGSTFTVYLPETYVATATPTDFATTSLRSPELTSPTDVVLPQDLFTKTEFIDDRYEIRHGDKTLLVIDDDEHFADVMIDIAHQKGFKAVVAHKGDTGLALAHEFIPDAIILDINLPVMDGWTLLTRLKHHPRTRHIPVQIISISEERHRGLQEGAFAYLVKPVSSEALDSAINNILDFIKRGTKTLLVVEDDEAQRKAIVELIGAGDLNIIPASTGEEALNLIKTERVDCMVLDLSLPDMDGFELLEEIKSRHNDLPVIVYTGRELTEKEETQLKRYADSIVIKGVSSPERLLDETALFLHRIESKLPKEKEQILKQLHDLDAVLANKKVLIVDDDVRNIFALTSVLENSVSADQPMRILFAENGRDGIEILEQNPDIDLVLMDIMMPGMDGYETIKELRKKEHFRKLAVIALTAKAMKGDREKCMEAGASDYIAKPVDVEKLLSLMRVWLYRGETQIN
jgi:HAMP domain-containing protein/CheY-like chemotaxis protein/signal transduction histidine kinase